MRKLTVFNNQSLDGYFCDANGDMSWAHKQDAEWTAFTAENASGGGELLFGRVTYEMMAGWWPSPMALAAFPVVAERMNNMPKVVFTRTLRTASWNNTRIRNGDLAADVRALKEEAGPDLVLMGSGQIVAQLTSAGLVDLYQVVVQPVVLGAGRSMFDGVQPQRALKLLSARTFQNGNVVLSYEPGA